MKETVFAENRRARFDYEFTHTYEAGVALKGTEVKSIRGGHIALAGSYALFHGGELWLVNANIPAYQPNNTPKEYEPSARRRLLLRRDELSSLSGKLREKGLSLIPIKIYAKHGLIKIELGLGRSRKQKDKRELLKKRTAMREAQREK